MDTATGAFQAAAGIACPPGCGKCCTTPTIEATVAECLPMARRIVARGDGERTLARLSELSARGDHTCVFYAATGGSDWMGRCTEYETRPPICRLFGFSARRRKDGAVR